MKMPFWPSPSGYRDIELGLSRVFLLLERVGNPHLKLPPTIHLAGTNGKGSTLSFLRAIFAESGLKIHTYISPHLVNFNERITLAGEEISDDFLNKILGECKAAAEIEPQIKVTFFEGITVAAFLAFSRVKADILLLETGMGGRLDATNVLPEVLCSIITPIAFDHQDFLGKTLAKIAFEKGGIIKKNCPTLIAKQKTSALRALINQALLLSSKTEIFGKNFQIKKTKNGFLFSGFGKKISLPLPSLIGDHQIENAAVAIAAALTQKKFIITENHIKSALQKTTWPARLQKITTGKFAKILPNNFELYLDGSHNLQGAATVQKFLQKNKDKKIYVIFSMLKDKDAEGFLRKIAKNIDQLITVKIANEPKSYKAAELQEISEKIGINAICAENFEKALTIIINQKPLVILEHHHKSVILDAQHRGSHESFGTNITRSSMRRIKDDGCVNKSDGFNDEKDDGCVECAKSLILVCGSLYLAGNFLEENFI